MSGAGAASAVGELAFTPPSTPPTPDPSFLSDVFSTTPPQTPFSPLNEEQPSDVPRLRSIHATAGYRDGVSEAKDQFLQAGFDEGYSIGAAFGLRIGCLLGAAESLLLATTKRMPEMRRQAHDLEGICKKMKEDLTLEKVFDRKWWDDDELWNTGCHLQQPDDKTNGISIQEIIDSHPLIERWSLVLKEERKRLHLREGRFEGPEWEKGRIED